MRREHQHAADGHGLEPGEFEAVRGVEDLYYHETGMYGTTGYGSVYVYDTPAPAVIDTGIGTNHDLLFETLSALGIDADDLAWILPTNAHLHHAGGAGFLAARYPNSAIRIHERGVASLVDPDRIVAATKTIVGDQWRHHVEPEPVPDARIDGLRGGDSIDLGDRRLDVYEASGHAPHQTIVHEPDDGVVFTGDAGGIYVPRRDTIRPTTSPPNFDLDQALADASTIADLDPEVLCFSHFGPREYDPEIVSSMKRTYVEWVQAVRQKRAELSDDEAVVRHFQETTELTDVWSEERIRANVGLNVRGVLSFLEER
ncbi:MBL fold metallo-hydrolase [Halopenitus sp. H-Gu1]|uniref:MBL fold metallo-hydrolase n=1 Tax=Halopenitus sp. H-Gu1 TaxID=3242697 RepID=UPI00359DA073